LIKVLKDYVNILTLSALGRSISLNPSVILNFQGGRRTGSDIIEKAIREIKRRRGES